MIKACTLWLLIGVSAFPAFGTTVIPNTTLTQETGNNTSVPDTFSGTSNGNSPAGNVSKVNVRSMLYANSNTRIYAHFMPWFGGTNHANVGYSSNSATQVHRQVDDMMSRGIQGVVIDWYGQRGSREDATTALMKTEAESRNGDFQFAIMEDAGAISGSSDLTGALINDLIYGYQHYEQSSAYIRYNGRPVVFFFGVESMNVNWTTVRQQVPGNPLFVFENAGSFTAWYSDGAFSWVGLSGNTSDWGQSYLDYFYQIGLTASGKLAVGSAKKGFNDGLAAWGSNRVVNQNCGQTWLSTMQEATRYYSSNSQLPFMQLVTWNDYEEGTSIESGIDNCVSLSGSASGDTLSWNISGGNENTIDHYTVFISNDGQNLMRVSDVPAGTHSLDLAQFSFDPNFYNVYVKAIGKPSIRNQISSVIGYTAVAVTSKNNPGGNSNNATGLMVAATPDVISLSAGHSATLNITVAPQSGDLQSAVSLSCAGPAGLICQFDQASVVPGSGAQVRLTVSAAANMAFTHSTTAPLALAFGLPGLGLGMLTLRRPAKSKTSTAAILSLIFVIATSLIGCGGVMGAPPSSTSTTSSTATSSIPSNSTTSGSGTTPTSSTTTPSTSTTPVSTTPTTTTASSTATTTDITSTSASTDSSNSSTTSTSASAGSSTSTSTSGSSGSSTTTTTAHPTTYNLVISASNGSLQASTVAVVTVQ